MRTILIIIMVLTFVSCGKPSNSVKTAPVTTNTHIPTVEYELNDLYTFLKEGNVLIYGDILEGAYDTIQERYARVDKTGCWTQSILYKMDMPNRYAIQVYGTSEFINNDEMCLKLEGYYWIELKSNHKATFTTKDGIKFNTDLYL